MPLSPSHTLAEVKKSGSISQVKRPPPSIRRQAPGPTQFSAEHRDGVGTEVGSAVGSAVDGIAHGSDEALQALVPGTHWLPTPYAESVS